MRNPFCLFRQPFAVALFAFGMSSILLGQVKFASGEESLAPSSDFHTLSSDSPSVSASDLPDAPGFYSSASAEGITLNQRGGEPWEGNRQYGPLSRVSIGADVSPLGVGIKSATILTRYLDARMLANYFNYNLNGFDLEGFQGSGSVHFFSMGAALDAYPRNSIWRVSGGMMLHNGNNFSATGEAEPGQSFSINNHTYYSAKPDAASGAAPLNGSGTLVLHTQGPEFFVSGGFGRFVPHSERHWSFPTEFGVLFMGSPTLNLTTAGWVCQNPEAGSCADISSATPVATKFNHDLQEQLADWRQSLSSFKIYPIFSYSVVYSFDVR